MLERIMDTLFGLPMTIISGVFLIISLVLKLTGNVLPIDPAWVSVVISGVPLLYLSIWRLIHNPGIKKISSALLISIAMIAAIAIGDLFAAGEVAFIMAIGGIIEEKTIERAKKGLKQLLSLAPEQGRIVIDGTISMIPIDEVKIGDMIRILPGETVPVDGEVVSGETSIDQSVITGESIPVDKFKKDKVFSGTLNLYGSVDIIATEVGEDSSLQKLIHLVQEADKKQAPMQRIADKWASWLVPVALLIALASYFWSGNIVTAVTVLVVFCPCALILATPTAIMAAIGQATKHGVIIKSGEALEKMGKVDIIAFDKTGTLTYGKLEVSDITSVDRSFDKEEILRIAASVEQRSEHPLGKAIVNHALSTGHHPVEVNEFKMQSGKGIYANLNGDDILCGSEHFMSENRIEINEDVKAILEMFRNQGKVSILIAQNGKCIGVISLSDVLRPDAVDMVNKLQSIGTDTILLTGDNQRTADYFAGHTNIKNVMAELLPQEKVDAIIKLKKDGKKVCMIGDGVNDAPALKVADVGIAMGDVGSDIAVEAADIALIGDDISKIPYLKKLSNATIRTIKLSIMLSLCINFVAIVLSLMEVLTPTTGALVHNAGSILVVFIAGLLYDRKFEA